MPTRRVFASATSWVVGLCALCSAIIAWVAGAEISQAFQQSNAFNKPFFIVWFNHIWLVPFLPTGLLWLWLSDPGVQYAAEHEASANFAQRMRAWGITPRVFVWRSFWLSVAYLVPNLCWFWALALTSVASVTALFNTSCIFVFIFSLALLGEPFVVVKLISVLVVATGAILVSLASSQSDARHEKTVRSPVGGSIIALVGALLYGLFEVSYKRFAVRSVQAVPEPVAVTMIWMGCMGLGTLCFCWIGLPLLHLLSLEPFSLPPHAVWLPLCINALCSLVFNASLMLSLAVLPSPTFVSVAVMLTIPTTMLCDYFIHDARYNITYIAGALLVASGFGLLSMDEYGPRCRAQPRYQQHSYVNFSDAANAEPDGGDLGEPLVDIAE